MECLGDVEEDRVGVLVVGHLLRGYAEDGGEDAIPLQDGKHRVARIWPGRDSTERMAEGDVRRIVSTSYVSESRASYVGR